MVLQQIPDRWERSKSSSREKNKKQEIVQSGPEEPKNLYIMGKRVKKKKPNFECLIQF